MASDKPWLSVLMPVYDGAAYLDEALASIVRQNDAGIECIVVDGGSSDDTVAIARRYAGKLDLVLLERPDSPNWVWSTNLALQRAAAPFCSMLHQDDYWLPGRVSAVHGMMRARPGLGLYVHDVDFVNADGRRVGSLTCPWRALPQIVDQQAALTHLLVQNFLSCPAPVFSTELARRVGGLDEALWYTADWDFWLKLAALTPLAYRREALAAFRIHGHSQTAKSSRGTVGFRQQMDVVVERHGAALAGHPKQSKVLQAASFSNALNAGLAARYHGERIAWGSLLRRGFALGPTGLWRYLVDSRIVSRSSARILARLRKAR